MNYFAHGYLHLDEPHFLAGTAVPDWLSVVNRKVRVRPNRVRPHTAAEVATTANLAAGILRHHADDAWFHETRAFAELSLQTTRAIRLAYPADDTLRPSFLGHILVELLLDACLSESEPDQLHAYYTAIEQVDSPEVERQVSTMAGQEATGLSRFIAIFLRERFLWDYREDGKLWFRLNQVMRRVRLPLLPESFGDVLATIRGQVADRWRELLTPAADTPVRRGA